MESVARTIRKLSLSTNTQPRIHKKYLGDKDDPHYVPDSPRIERQFFTAEEEEELKLSCTLLLADVPHSDDMSDDPLKYIAAQIQTGKAARPAHVKPTEPVAPAQKTEPVATSVTQQFLDLSTSTAPSSQASQSHRDTIDTLTTAVTDFSTPLTSAGLTPGETARRFSDAARKSVNSQRKPVSSLRNETSSKNESRTASNAGVTLSKSIDPNNETEAIKRTLRVVADDSRPVSASTKSVKMSTDNSRPARFSIPDLNKSLPPPPPAGDATPISEQDEHDQKVPHISRLMKTIRRKKSSPAMLSEARAMSTSAIPPPLPALATKAPNNVEVFKSVTDQPPQAVLSPVKKKFKFRLFKRTATPEVLAA